MKNKYYVQILFFLVLSVLFTHQLWDNTENWGTDAWYFYETYYDYARTSIIEEKVFPLWNRYLCGGHVFLEHPQISILPMKYFFTLLFGTLIGIRLFLVFYMTLGMFGMYLLSRQLGLKNIFAFFPPIAFILTSLDLFAYGGDFHLSITYIPFVFYFLLKSETKKKFILLSALFTALILLDNGVYLYLYTILFVFLFCFVSFVVNFIRNYKSNVNRINLKFLKLFLIFIFFVVLFTLPKSFSIIEIMNDNPRKIESLHLGFTIEKYFDSLLFRDQISYYKNNYYDVIKTGLNESKYYDIKDKPWKAWHDVGNYIGIVLFIFSLIGMIFYKNRIMFFILLIFLWLSFGNSLKYSLWNLLSKFPLWDSLRDPVRFNVYVVFILSIFAGIGAYMLYRIILKFLNKKNSSLIDQKKRFILSFLFS
jgi:hypothetical protein